MKTSKSWLPETSSGIAVSTADSRGAGNRMTGETDLIPGVTFASSGVELSFSEI